MDKILVFLGHVSEDYGEVRKLKNSLEAGGEGNVEVWIFEETKTALGNTGITSKINQKIAESDYVVLIWSEQAQKKPEWLKLEFDTAANREIELTRNQKRSFPFLHIYKLDKTNILQLPDWMGGREASQATSKLFFELGQEIAGKGKPSKDNRKSSLAPLLQIDVLTMMSTNYATVFKNDTLREAYDVMTQFNTPFAVVLDNDSFSGYLTISRITNRMPPELYRETTDEDKRQLYDRSLEDALDKSRVRDVFVPANRIKPLRTSDKLELVLKVFLEPHPQADTPELRYRSIPVSDDGKEVRGVIAYWHMFDYLVENYNKHLTDNISWRPIADYSVSAESTLVQTFTKSSRHSTDLAIVDADLKFIRIIRAETLKNLLDQHFPELKGRLILELAEEVNSDPSYSVSDGITLSDAAKALTDRLLTLLCQIDDKGKLIGVISYIDVLEKLRGKII